MATKRDREPLLDSKPPVPPKSKHPVDNAVDTFFENDLRLRAAMSRNLKERSATTLKDATRAKNAFVRFAPSKYSVEERARRNFVGPDGDADAVKRSVLDKGVSAIRATAPQRAMRIHLDSELGKRIKGNGGVITERLGLGEFITHLQSRISGPVTASTGPAFTKCRAEREAQRRLNEVLGVNDAVDPLIETPPTATDKVAANLDTDQFVSQQVRTQMKTATSPEEQLLFAVPSRASPAQTDKAIETFELRAGPADVTSYHDFNNLQIAFEHVWAEIFDGRLGKLGQELYNEYVKLQEFVGVPATDRNIDTIDDLKALMDEIRELGRLTNESTPTDLRPPDGADTTTTAPITTDTVVDVVQTVLDPASVLTDAIGNETVAAILNPAGALIGAIADLIKGTPQIKWASFPGPLPGNADKITVTIEQDVAPVGVVEIELQTGPNTHGWKGIHFVEFDDKNRPTPGFWIANDPRDPGVWSKTSFNRLPLFTPQVLNGMLEFWHEGIFSIHARCYVIAGLAEKLKDRARVTFTWTKD